jgi:hypothetical protein
MTFSLMGGGDDSIFGIAITSSVKVQPGYIPSITALASTMVSPSQLPLICPPSGRSET